MHFERRSHYSGHLNREMNFNVYGHAGKPVVVFPSSGGSQNEFADFGMIEACQSFIDRGLLRFYTPDSIDKESWLAETNAHSMAENHNRYDEYIVNEFVPLIRYEANWDGPMVATGCSMGGFHTVNFALKHPDVFDTSIALSGVYDARFFTGEFYGDQAVYFNSPIDYLPGLNEPWFIDQYRQNTFIIAVGQGDWEGPHIEATRQLQGIFSDKQLPAWFDYWGHDVPHDWDAWRNQLPYFFSQLEQQGKI
uniref:esterase family protein n=1 Tax=Candidatus Enterococcus willemsii TaxID=1857215 RepID=UPI00403F9B90